ncbi:MAG: sulfite exporter TauE/SafE family protein [Candidatus Pelethousia sp.]|nr:sulfite exporter TauE/SafE family protein [Candidatus Pelethousia sp.]
MDAAVKGLWYILAGAIAGMLAGMGMGGGTLLIPVLSLLLGVAQHQAQGVNMFSFLPAALVALWVHRKEGRVALKTSWPIIGAGIVGAVLGALGATVLEGPWLKKIFGTFLIILGFFQWRKP